jgi:phosphate:Na+ symporter
MDVFKIVMGLLAGLVLFLHGVSLLSESLKKAAGERMKKLLASFTTNRFAGVLTGTVATTLLDSSSVTIIMVIALVNAGLLSFTRSLGVIMGSNIGTTISSQIIALHINKYAPIALVTGFGLYMIAKSKRWKRIGGVVFGMGLIFFGLDVMGKAVEPLQQQASFIEWMTRMEAPILGALVGAAFTVMVQSSSATLGVVITLASQELISLPAGIAIMLGAEIGTCADTLVATLGRSREAIRAGVFHLLFNIITVSIGVAFAHPFTALVQYISTGTDVSRQIANAHVLFNVAGVLLFISFMTPVAKGLQWLIPQKAKRQPDAIVEPGVA